MLSSIEKFIDQKTGSSEIANGLVYVCQAGSFISGTNDETSDLDFRAVTLLPTEYHLGLKTFEHSKLIAGEGGINSSNDFDIEIFSPRQFIKEAYHGEIVTLEMLFVPDKFRQYIKRDFMQPILDIRESFLSKSLVKRYIGFIKGCQKKALVPIGNLKRADKIERSQKYGYETKDAMNSIKCSRMMLELLGGQGFNIYREDREELLEIKRGKYTRDEYVKISDEYIAKLELELIDSKLIDRPNFDETNQFLIEYTRMIYSFLK